VRSPLGAHHGFPQQLDETKDVLHDVRGDVAIYRSQAAGAVARAARLRLDSDFRLIFGRRCDHTGLPHSRLHPIGCFKIFSGIGDERSIARMIDSFDSRNNIHELWIMMVNVLHEFGLGICGAGDEDGTCVCNRFSDRLEEGVILRSMSAADGVRLMMDMSGGIMWVENQLVDVRPIEMKYASFMMIYPDDGMIVLVHKMTPIEAARWAHPLLAMGQT
jgi:hypothetical protein